MILVEVPVTSLEKTKGCEKAPYEITKKLDEIWSNEEGKQLSYKIERIAEENIFEKSIDILKAAKGNEKVIFIGGDHSITFHTFKAFNACFEDSAIVVFDAHADCMKPKKIEKPNHEEWLRTLAEKFVDPKRIFLVGARNNDIEEIDFLKKSKINLFFVNEFAENLNNVKELMESVRSFKNLYVSIDIDVVDPAFAPGTTYLEPAGFSAREIVYIIQHLKLLKNLKALDIVEVNPEKDINGLTVKLAAKLIAEMK